MKSYRPVIYVSLGLASATALLAVLGAVGAFYYVSPSLPSVDTLRDIQLQVPLRVYSRDGRLLREFGEKRRVPASYEEIPRLLVDAFVAAEDDRFFHHPGVDYQGLVVRILLQTWGSPKGSPVSLCLQMATQRIGLFLIIGLFLFVTFNDVMRIGE